MTKKTLTEIFSFAKIIVVAAVFALFLNNFVLVNAKIPSGSMENTIMTGDRVVAFRLSYLFSSPGRFDIVVFPNPDNTDELNIKRIIGMPGETVRIFDGDVFINGEILEEASNFAKQNYNSFFWGDFGPYNVPYDRFFVLGDNRNNSTDSRHWYNTTVAEDQIIGRAVFKYFRNLQLLR